LPTPKRKPKSQNKKGLVGKKRKGQVKESETMDAYLGVAESTTDDLAAWLTDGVIDFVRAW
jgi:hypothetical protein